MAKKAPRRKAASSARKSSTKGQKATAARKGTPKRASAKKKPAAKRSKPVARKKSPARRPKAALKRFRGLAVAAARTAAGKKKKTRVTAKVAKPVNKAVKKKTTRKEGGSGRESGLAQTPETGRSVQGPTNPFPTRRSTGTAAGAGGTRLAPGLERARRQLREVEETVSSPPSSLDIDRRRPSAARSGREEMGEARRNHPEVSPEITAGDVDADWQGAYADGDEAPGGDNPTPDQDRVDDIGKALGVVYEDNEELKASDKIAERDRKRWELDPASSDDYQDRD
jgi:Family of unknown function (DUF6335)